MSDREDEEEEIRARPQKPGIDGMTGAAIAKMFVSTSDIVDSLKRREETSQIRDNTYHDRQLALYDKLAEKQEKIAELQLQIAELKRQDEAVRAKEVEAKIAARDAESREKVAATISSMMKDVGIALGGQALHAWAEHRAHKDGDLTWAEDLSLRVTEFVRVLVKSPEGEAAVQRHAPEFNALMAVLKAYHDKYGAPPHAAPAAAPQAEST